MEQLTRLDKASLVVAFIDQLRKAGSWAGETHLQKASYFLQELLQVPLGCNFILYKHGPFSFDLREDLAAMHAGGFVDWKPRGGGYGPSLIPGQRSDQLAREFPKAPQEFETQIGYVASKLGQMTVVDLERLGTALYVMLQSPNQSITERAAAITELKPHIEPDAAESAVRAVDEMKSEVAKLPNRKAAIA